eukprot:11192736-Lingulodinium_polyedra.AAC.1
MSTMSAMSAVSVVYVMNAINAVHAMTTKKSISCRAHNECKSARNAMVETSAKQCVQRNAMCCMRMQHV